MNFMVSARTDAGPQRPKNQDSLTAKTLITPMGRMAFAAICDGMGGLSAGEVASATVLNAFNNWLYRELPEICTRPIDAQELERRWCEIIRQQNDKLLAYGNQEGLELGTTLTAILLTEQQYYIIHVGDTRVYEINDAARRLTSDHTLVAEELRRGQISLEQAQIDPRRNILLQCIGASKTVCPEMIVGTTARDAVYLLCSDGFRHEISAEELQQHLNPGNFVAQADMTPILDWLIEQNRMRNEQDNISAITIRTF